MAINSASKTTTLEEISVKTQSKLHSADEKKKKRPQYPGKEEPIKEVLVEEEKEIPEEKPIRPASMELQRGEQDQGESTVSEEEVPKIEEKREKYGSFVLDDMKSSDGGGKADKKLFLLGVSVFVGTVIVCGLAFFLFFKTPEPQKKIVTEVKTTPTPTPIVPIFKREEWSLEVLNGSGKSGVAKKTADKLEALGYKIENTGNAPKRYAKTEIFISSEKTVSDINLFLEDMKKELGVGTSSGDLSDSTVDVQIIVGTDNAE